MTLHVRLASEQGLGDGQASVRSSICLSHRRTVATTAGGFAASRRYRSTAAGAVQQAPALSSKCGQRHDESRRRRLNKVLFKSVVRYYFTSLCSNLCINFLDNFVFWCFENNKRAYVPGEQTSRCSRRRYRGAIVRRGAKFMTLVALTNSHTLVDCLQ